jgi:hypothetical protein
MEPNPTQQQNPKDRAWLYLGFFIVIVIAIIFIINKPDVGSKGTTTDTGKRPWEDYTWEVADTVGAQGLVQSFRQRADEFTGIEWYKDPKTPRSRSARTFIHAYFGKKDTALLPLRWGLNYVAEEWLFIQRITVRTDTTNELPFLGSQDMNRDNAGGKIWEWCDQQTNVLTWPMLIRIAKAKRTVIRFEGRQYYSDYVVSRSDAESIRRTLDVYTTMGGHIVP